MLDRTTLGPYRIESELGSGGMGAVWLAEAVEQCAVPAGTRVALKVVHPHLLSEPGFFKRFLREAEIGKAVTHPNVVRCYDCDQLVVDGTTHAFLVMEYVEGQTLRDLLDDLQTVPEELCRHIGREVSKGLAAIHEVGVVHRDLKPENVLITADHEVKIMDLGVARLADEAIRLSMSGAFVGSVLYASPEHFKGGGGDLDGRADLFSLGVILYELASGAHPHPGDDFATVLAKVMEEQPRRLGQRNPQLSAFFEEVVHALLAKNREERFASGSKLLEVLEHGEKSTWWGRRAKALRAETKRPLRRIRIPRETAVYGREEELGKLTALYEKAKEGDGQVVLIEGEAGVGKTRLADELAGRLHQAGEDLNFLFGSNPPGGAATAWGAWSSAYREQFGAEGLEENLREYLTATPVLVPAFAALLRGEPPPEGKEPLTKDSIQTIFVHATRALAEERPTVVLIEDLHFAPEEGRALFASLALAAPGHRTLLVGTARPGIPEDWKADLERLDQTHRINLSRLGPRDLGRLLRDAFQSERLAEELALKIATKSDGNPFFVFEIIRGLREGDLLTREPDGSWVCTQVIREIRIPSSVQELVKARIADLDEEEQELLEVAACCGFEFDPALVAEALELRLVPALRRLGHLERAHRLVRSSGDDFVFDHHQVQEALYSGMAPRLRREYHAAIGMALAARHPRPDGGVAVELCEHFLQGDRGDLALPHLHSAQCHLENLYLNDKAVALADRALEVDGLLAGTHRAEVLLKRATTLGLLGRREAEEAALEEATALADEAGDPELKSRVSGQMGRCHLAQSRLDRAQTELLLARTLARECGAGEFEVSVGASLGMVYINRGDYEEALDHLGQALETAHETGDRNGAGQVLGSLGLALFCLGDTEGAEAQLEQALQIAREIGDRNAEARARLNLANILMAQGRFEEMRDHAERSLANSRERGDRSMECISLGNLGAALLELGIPDDALGCFERCRSIAVEIGDPRGEGVANLNLGAILLSQGHYEQAQTNSMHYLAYALETGDRRAEAMAHENLGHSASALGHSEEARGHHAAGVAIAREIGDRQVEAGALRTLGQLLSRLGDLGQARALLEESRAILRSIGARVEEGHALRGLAEVALANGDEGLAERLLRDDLALQRQLGSKRGTPFVLVALAMVLIRKDCAEEARSCLREARDLGRETGSPGVMVVVDALAAQLGGDAGSAYSSLQEFEPRLSLGERLEARYALWNATLDADHIEEAHRLLCHLRDHAPEEYRETMIANVPLHRDIMAAWEENQAAS